MSTCPQSAHTRKTNVGMAQIAYGKEDGRLVAVLGSCVGVAVYHRETRTAGLAHVMLPQSHNNITRPGKFADTAVAALVHHFTRRGIRAESLIAKIAGGASMFGGPDSPLQIGAENIRAVSRALAEANVRLATKDVGGTQGRRIAFDCTTGNMRIEIAGAVPRTI